VLLDVALLLALVGSGLMAGLFFAFSVAVMPALAHEPVPAAMTAMQRINVAIVRPVFLLVFVGTLVVAVAAAIFSVLDPDAATPWGVAGAVLYLVTSVGLTAGYHVPRNNALVAADPATAEGAGLWATYLREWVPWNHVRAIGCVLATASFAIALART